MRGTTTAQHRIRPEGWKPEDQSWRMPPYDVTMYCYDCGHSDDEHINIPVKCPDGREGCAVYHFKTICYGCERDTLNAVRAVYPVGD